MPGIRKLPATNATPSEPGCRSEDRLRRPNRFTITPPVAGKVAGLVMMASARSEAMISRLVSGATQDQRGVFEGDFSGDDI
jgi:hypothetical protein